jgi:glycosyltransferase involved in cell wall biosynthesis
MSQILLTSIIIPSYNEAENIKLLAKEICDVMGRTKYKYEILFVNDGSTDNSWEIIVQLTQIYPFIRGIDLAGNYGQTAALRAGIDNSTGDVIVAMDGDMQHDSVYIPPFLKLIEEGYDMVSGSKEQRPEGRIRSFAANMAHKLICLISGVNMKYFGATFKAYRRYLFNNVNMIGDTHRYLGALFARKGTRYTEVAIKIRQRNAGVSNYKLSKAFMVIADLFSLKFSLSFLQKPFRLFGIPGLLLFTIGTGLVGYYAFGGIFLHWSIGKNYVIEFISAIFLVLFAFLLISIGLIAQIGVFNYFSDKKHEPFAIREQTHQLVYHE